MIFASKKAATLWDETELQEQEQEVYLKKHRPEWERTGQRYKKVRQTLGISLTNAAQKIGISKTTLGKFEKGYAVLSAGMVEHAYGLFLELSILKREEVNFKELLDMAQDPWKYGLEQEEDEGEEF